MNVYLDYDNVLVDWNQGFCDYLRVKGIVLYKKDITYYEYVSHKYPKQMEDFYSNSEAYSIGLIKPLPGAIEFVNSLQEEGFKVKIISNTFESRQCEISKENHIRNYFNFDIRSCGSGDTGKIIHTKDKFKFTTNGILIEDNYKMALQHTMVNNQTCFLFNHSENYPYVKNAYDRIKSDWLIEYYTSYDSMLNKLKAIKEDSRENI